MIVIDEAHCCSSMGHDFRPDYRKLFVLRKLFPKTPIMSLSATSPPNIVLDVCKILGLSSPPSPSLNFVSLPISRFNLSYQILPKPGTYSQWVKEIVTWILKRHPQEKGILYCATISDCTKLSVDIQSLSQNQIKTRLYHASLPHQIKTLNHMAFIHEKDCHLLVATIAFGMGIDIPNVSLTFRNPLPKPFF